MNYDDRPWLGNYEESLTPEVSVPDVTVFDLMEGRQVVHDPEGPAHSGKNHVLPVHLDVRDRGDR